MEYKDIIIKKEDFVGTIIFNRPDSLNATTVPMLQELVHALNDMNGDENVRVVVLTGMGEAFGASMDLKTEDGGEKKFQELASSDPEECRKFMLEGPIAVTLLLQGMEKPTIAMVNGLAVGNAVDWALACDMRIGSEKTRFMNAFIRMGLTSSTGGAWLCPRIMGLGRALEFLLSGDWLYAEEAYKLGVLNKIVPSTDLEKETYIVAKKLANGPPMAIKLTKKEVYQSLSVDLSSSIESSTWDMLKVMTSEDYDEALAAFSEKRKPVFKGK